MNPKLKICGLMRREDIEFCCRAGVDICGFVAEYPLDVPWNLSREQCAVLLPAVQPPSKSCIVTGGSREKIIELALALKPAFVQLHYHETLDDTRAIVHALSSHHIGIIKTLPAAKEERLLQFGTSDLNACVNSLNSAGVCAILVDARSAANAAGSGQMADLQFYRCVKAASTSPVMLGGGITPENCGSVITEVAPHILDVMTGVEIQPGEKDHTQISSLLHCLQDVI